MKGHVYASNSPNLLRASSNLSGNKLLQIPNSVIFIALHADLLANPIVTDNFDHFYVQNFPDLIWKTTKMHFERVLLIMRYWL